MYLRVLHHMLSGGRFGGCQGATDAVHPEQHARCQCKGKPELLSPRGTVHLLEAVHDFGRISQAEQTLSGRVVGPPTGLLKLLLRLLQVRT
jgi:hypothetical protein